MTFKRSILLLGAAVILTVLGVFVYGLCQAFHRFAVEDEIHCTFYPLAMALFKYQDDHGSAATSLVQLVPRYIPELPKSSLAESVEYSVLDGGKAWRLAIHSRALAQARAYCCRSNEELSDDEKRRTIGSYHGIWTVLKEPSSP